MPWRGARLTFALSLCGRALEPGWQRLRANESCECSQGNFLEKIKGRISDRKWVGKAKSGREGALFSRSRGCRGFLGLRVPQRASATCPRAGLRREPEAGERESEAEPGAAEQPQAGTQRARCPGSRAQGPPTGGGAGERAREAAAAAAAGLPRASPPLPGPRAHRADQGAEAVLGARARGVPGAPPAWRGVAGRGAAATAGAASASPWASGWWFGLSPPQRPPAPARRPPPAPARGLERASLAAPGLESRRRSSCESRREHQPPPPRELLWPHHAGAGHRDRGPSPALRGLRVSSGATRAGARGRGDPRTERLCAPTLFAPPRPFRAWIRGVLPTQCPGCVLRDPPAPLPGSLGTEGLA